MGKTVLITGGNKGIGLAVTEIFLNRGDKVIVVGRDFASFPYKDDPNVQMVPFDVANLDEIPELVKGLGEIDILINNAGISLGKSYREYPEEDIKKILNVNLRAPIAFITAIVEGFLKRGEGRIVNVASQAAEIGHSDIWYGITKAGLINVTRSFATELGGKGIVINAVSPGPVETDMTKDPAFQDRFKKVVGRTYLGRMAYAGEVAKTIVWLAEDSPVYINGENIDINNGVQRINK